jgi:hypothetical protein
MPRDGLHERGQLARVVRDGDLVGIIEVALGQRHAEVDALDTLDADLRSELDGERLFVALPRPFEIVRQRLPREEGAGGQHEGRRQDQRMFHTAES